MASEYIEITPNFIDTISSQIFWDDSTWGGMTPGDADTTKVLDWIADEGVIGHLPTHEGKVFSHWAYGNQSREITDNTYMIDLYGGMNSQIFAIFEDEPTYTIILKDNGVTLGTFSTYISTEQLSTYINQVTVPNRPGYVLKGWKYPDETDVDPSSTIAQAASLVGGTTITIHTYFVSIKSIVSVIFNGTEYGFTVDGDTLARVATTGQYDDLIGQPEIPVVNDATISFTEGGISKGSFSLNQSSNESIELFPVGTFFESFENAVYDSFGRLRSFTADDVNYTLTYEGGRLKTISNGTDTYVATYSGNLLQTVRKLVI